MDIRIAQRALIQGTDVATWSETCLLLHRSTNGSGVTTGQIIFDCDDVLTGCTTSGEIPARKSGKDRIDLKPPAPLVSVQLFVPH